MIMFIINNRRYLRYIFSFTKNALIECDSLISLELVPAPSCWEDQILFWPLVFLVLLRLVGCNAE